MRPVVHTRQTDSFLGETEVARILGIPIVEASQLLSGLSVVALSEVWIMRRARSQRGFLDFPRFSAREGCGRHCAVLLASVRQSICSLHTATLDEWSGPVGAERSQTGPVFRSSHSF